MNVVLDLTRDLESELAAEAVQLGLTLPEYVVRLLTAGRVARAAPRTGAELVACWQAEGLVGTRSDIADSQRHGRAMRAQAARRARP
jgi:hypothetical protein